MTNIKNVFKKNLNLTQTAGIVAFFTFATKISALYRERVFTSTLGQGAVSDSYFSAFRIPDFVTNLFILSTLSVAFLPILAKENNQNENQANEFTNTILNLTLLVVGSICLGLLIFSGPLTKILVPGFTNTAYQDTLNLTRLFLLSPIIFSVSTILSGTLNAKRKFFITSFTPILYNFGIIFGTVALYPKYGIMGLGYGVILGAMAQTAVQFFSAIKNNFQYRLVFNLKLKALNDLLKLYLPRIFTFDLANITLILSSTVASSATLGSITAINQAFNLQSVPIGIFAYALASASFPVLAEQFAKKDEIAFNETLRKVIVQVLFYIIPITILMLIFRAHIVRLILGTGKFNPENFLTTFTTTYRYLGLFSFALLSQSLTTLLSRVFYSRHNTKLPVMANLGAIIVNIALSLLLAKKFGIDGLIYGFIFSSTFNLIILVINLRKVLLKEAGAGLVKILDSTVINSFVKILLISLGMGIFTYTLSQALEPFINPGKTLDILLQSGLGAGGGTLLYLGLAAFFQMPEAQPYIQFCQKIFKKVKKLVDFI